MRVAVDDDPDARGFGIEVEIFEFVQEVDGRPGEPDRLKPPAIKAAS